MADQGLSSAIDLKSVTVGNWPLPVIRPFQKANLNTGHSEL
jgi:hypothetical protein